MFRRADRLRPGSYETLSGKARQIGGGPANNATVDGKDPAVVALAAGRVDIVIGYCNSAELWPSQMAELRIVTMPSEMSTEPELVWRLKALTGARSTWRCSCCPGTGSRFVLLRFCTRGAARARALSANGLH